MSHTIVLAHGILGFGELFGLPAFVNYFNGVASHLRRNGHVVAVPQVNPVGSVEQRGRQLAAAILQLPFSGVRFHVIAHSMGGLDARFALAHVPSVADRVATLVTIGTPHRGSPVADAVMDHSKPLFRHIPPLVLAMFERVAGGLRDLTTDVARRADDETPDVAGIHYFNIAGDASKGAHPLSLFKLAAAIGQITGEVNDGVVTKTSALRAGHEALADWPVDHFGEIGWSLESPIPILTEPLLIPAPHIPRFDAIVRRF